MFCSGCLGGCHQGMGDYTPGNGNFWFPKVTDAPCLFVRVKKQCRYGNQDVAYYQCAQDPGVWEHFNVETTLDCPPPSSCGSPGFIAYAGTYTGSCASPYDHDEVCSYDCDYEPKTVTKTCNDGTWVSSGSCWDGSCVADCGNCLNQWECSRSVVSSLYLSIHTNKRTYTHRYILNMYMDNIIAISAFLARDPTSPC